MKDLLCVLEICQVSETWQISLNCVSRRALPANITLLLSTQQGPSPRSFPRREVTKQYSETSRALILHRGLVRRSIGMTLPNLALFRQWKDTLQTPAPEMLLSWAAPVAVPTTILMPSGQSSSDSSHCSFPKSTVHPVTAVDKSSR
jgi:hypothetical protein